MYHGVDRVVILVGDDINLSGMEKFKSIISIQMVLLIGQLLSERLSIAATD